MTKFNIDELDDLEIPTFTRSIQLINAIKKNESYEFVGSKLFKLNDENGLEILIVNLVCDGVPDVNSNGIQYRERLGLVTSNRESDIPEVWTLRDSFPCLPHMNDRFSWMPNSICLYFENSSVINRTWTPEKFLKRIYWWIERSSKGELHHADQPLEQFFFDSKYELVLPKESGNNLENINRSVYISKTIERADGACTFFVNSDDQEYKNETAAHIVYIEFSPVINEMISPNPSMLSELYEVMSVTGDSVKDILKEHIQSLIPADGHIKNGEICRTIIIVKIPIVRSSGGEIERTQLKAFLTIESPFEIGEKSGFLFQSPHDNKLYKDINLHGGGNVSTPYIKLFPVEVLKMNSKDDYRQQSGAKNSGGECVLIGLGALGSALFELWNRSGWGEWTLIDKDHLKPHNLTRHIGSIDQVGLNKAAACAVIAKQTTDNVKNLRVFESDVMAKDENVKESLSNTSLVIDVSTTIDYPRSASFIDEYSRHCSIFITPSGNDSVILLEDKDRIFKLRTLEAQYYRAILNSDWGDTHLIGHLGKFISGASCRDISLKLPFSSVMFHAAILSDQIMTLSEQEESRILIWRKDKSTGSVDLVRCSVSEEIKCEIGEYQIYYDNGLKEKLDCMRNTNLPAETGGILLGYHDLNLNSIFIVDALPAPLDSISTETEFQRGTIGTTEQVESCRAKTANVVDYIGEWHSHPKNISANPSGKDIVQLSELSKILSEDGLPALQVIISDDELIIFIGEVVDVF